MRLLYIANARLPTEKAHGIQIMKMCEAFSESGLDVRLLIPRRFDERSREDLFDFYGVKKIFRISRIPSIDLYVWGSLGYFVRTLSFGLVAFIYSLFIKADFIYSRDDFPLFLVTLISKKCFFEVHTAKKGWFTKRTLNNCMGTIFISNGLKEFFSDRGHAGLKSFVSHDAVDLVQFNAIKENKSKLRIELSLPDVPIIGYVGKLRTMGEEKGVETLIRSFAMILKSLPDAVLLLVGIYPHEEREVRNLLKKEDISETNFRIVLHVSQVIAFKYMKSADVLVMNYPNTPHYAKYMSPLKMFEYMASGTPVVTTDLPTVREVLSDDSALFIPPSQELALTSGILNILNNPGLAENIRKNALIAVQKHTWHNRAVAIAEYMENAHGKNDIK